MLYSPAYFAACAVGGALSCGVTHGLLTPIDLVKCDRQANPHLFQSGATSALRDLYRGSFAALGWGGGSARSVQRVGADGCGVLAAGRVQVRPVRVVPAAAAGEDGPSPPPCATATWSTSPAVRLQSSSLTSLSALSRPPRRVALLHLHLRREAASSDTPLTLSIPVPVLLRCECRRRLPSLGD